MFRVYDCAFSAHDPQLLALTFLLCVFASITAMVMAQRGSAASGTTQVGWLTAAGVITGIGIWTTHFSGMLAFKDIDLLGLYSDRTIAGLTFTIALSIVGWILAVSVFERRPWIGGIVIGMGLIGAHYIDAEGIAFAGSKEFDPGLVLMSVVLGLSLCSMSTTILSRKNIVFAPLIAGSVLALGITGLHLVGMAGMTLTPDPTVPDPQNALNMRHLGDWVITASVGILLVGLSLSIYDRHTATALLEDRRRLSESLLALTHSQEHYRAAMELNPQIPWTACPEGHCLEMGPKWAEFVGRDVKDALGTGWAAAIHPDDLELLKVTWSEALHAGTPYDQSFRIRGKDQNYRWFRCRGRPWRDTDGRVLRWYGSLEDIHERVLAETSLKDSEELYRLASCATNDLIWDWRPQESRVIWSDAIGTRLGYPEAAEGTPLAWWAERVHPDDIGRITKGLNAAIASADTNWEDEYRFRKPDGTYVDILSRGHIIRDADGRAVRAIGAMMDISARKRAEETLRHAAHYDALTGLPNRTLFHLSLDDALRQAEAQQSGVALMVLDVDQFKHLNDTRGHDAGDRLLRWIGVSLEQRLPAGAQLARLGGDEFAIIFPNSTPETLAADTLLCELRNFALGQEVIEISLSAGIAFLPQDATDGDALLKAADLALYGAKSDGRGRVSLFHPDMGLEAERRVAMLERAKSALRDDRILPFYQPKVCLRTGRVLGFEALLRIKSISEGIHYPATILAALQDLELGTAITDRMMMSVLDDARAWLSRGLDFGHVGINVSAADIYRGNFADRLLGKLREFDIAPRHVEVEITETVFLGRNSEHVAAVLRELNGEGISIALDDFGTGYASLSHLGAFPVDTLKIDQSFVRTQARGDRSLTDRAIVGAIVGLSKALGLRTVAEGVETADQAAQLIGLNCDTAQGFLFSRAVAASRVPYLVETGPQIWLPHLSQHNNVPAAVPA